MASPEAEARACYNIEYFCPGPTRLSPNLGGEHPPVGKVICIDMCMDYPDCGCDEYDRAVARWERAKEEACDA